MSDVPARIKIQYLLEELEQYELQSLVLEILDYRLHDLKDVDLIDKVMEAFYQE